MPGAGRAAGLLVWVAVAVGCATGSGSNASAPAAATGPNSNLTPRLKPILTAMARAVAADQSGQAQPAPVRVAVGLHAVRNDAQLDSATFNALRQQLVRGLLSLGPTRGLTFVDSPELRRYALHTAILPMADDDQATTLVHMILTRGGRPVWEDVFTASRP